MVHDTPPSQDASTNQIWYSQLEKYKRYGQDKIILQTRPEVIVKVTGKWYATLPNQKMHPHT